MIKTESLYRPDIDGLRALAVCSVILFHAFPQMLPGGFAGVDVFFVISGYLITGILLREQALGSFSVVQFYVRRVRRIFPALITVLLFCLVFGWYMLTASEYSQLGKHALAGIGFVANFVFWLESGYFDEAASLKPFLHLWSLGVEEQFYIVWPLLLWLGRRSENLLKRLLWGSVLLSFFLSIVLVMTDVTAAFYSPLCRLWELGAGGLLAFMQRGKELPDEDHALRNGLSIAGLGMLTLSLAFINESRLFPGFWALLPVLGTSALIAAGPFASVNRTFLSARWMVSIGLISYPLYLWHWPLLSFATIYHAGTSPVEWRLLLVPGMFILAVLTYFYIEKPLRRKGPVIVLVLLVCGLLVGGLGWAVYSHDGYEHRLRKLVQLPDTHKRDFAKWEEKGMYPVGQCDPDFVYPGARLCANSIAAVQPSIVVFGDSHAFSLYWGVAKAFESDGIGVRLIGHGSGCLPIYAQRRPECRVDINHKIDWVLASSEIKTVVLSHRNFIYDESESEAVDDFERSLRSTFAMLLQKEKRVMYVISIPEMRVNPRMCIGDLPMGRRVEKSQCTFSLQREHEIQKRYRSLVSRVLVDFPAVEVVNLESVVCPNNLCGVEQNNIVLFYDDNHLSESAAYIAGRQLYGQWKDSVVNPKTHRVGGNN